MQNSSRRRCWNVRGAWPNLRLRPLLLGTANARTQDLIIPVRASQFFPLGMLVRAGCRTPDERHSNGAHVDHVQPPNLAHAWSITRAAECTLDIYFWSKNATSRPEWLIEMEKPMSTWRSVQNLISRELVEHVMPRKGEKNLRHIEQKRVRKGKVANWSPPGERRNGCTYAHKIGRGRGGRCPESKRAAKGGGEVDARARGASGESKKPQAKTTDPTTARGRFGVSVSRPPRIPWMDVPWFM